MRAILGALKYLLIAIGATLAVAVLIWMGIFIFAPSMNIEKAFVMIFYPSVGAGIAIPLLLKVRSSQRKT